MAVAAEAGPSNTLGTPPDRGRETGSAMTSRQRLLSILIGIVGAIGSCLALAAFVMKMRSNGLALPAAPTSQAFYQSVGTAYSGGFAVGFSLCFFLALLAVAVGTWLENRRNAAAMRIESVRIPVVTPGPRG